MSFDPTLIEIPEPELLFGYGQRMEHPKDGLLLYGPKDSPQAGSKLRIGVVSTAEGLRRYSKCVERLARCRSPTSRIGKWSHRGATPRSAFTRI